MATSPSYNTDRRGLDGPESNNNTPTLPLPAPPATDAHTLWEISLPTGLLLPTRFPSQTGYTTTLIMNDA